MRILWVKIGALWPINTGGRLRSFHIISELAKRHEVSVMHTCMAAEDSGELIHHLPHCKSVRAIHHDAPKQGSPRFVTALLRSWLTSLPVDLYKNRSADLREEVEAALASGDFDLCIADFLVAVPNVPLGGPVPVIYFSHNVEYMIWRRLRDNERSFARRAVLTLEWQKMRRYEIAASSRADLTVTVSEEDRKRLLAESTSNPRIHGIPTGVDTDYFRPQESEEASLELVFTGSMDWHPNEDAILYFIDEVLPLVQTRFPTVSLNVVGRNPSAGLRKAAQDAGAHVSGTVDDIRPWMATAAVYIVPIRIGGGTRLKIYEALAMGKAVVSTSIGAEGLPLNDGEHIRLADDAASFAEAVIELLDDREARRNLGAAGRRLVEERYAWSRVGEAFEQLCEMVTEQLVEKEASRRQPLREAVK